MTDFTYDAFVSYSRHDREWADALNTQLGGLGITPFLDRERLRPGEAWHSQLIQSLRGSRHLIVLWSQHAADSGWVTKELSRFEAEADPEGDGLTAERRIFMVNLEDEDVTMSGAQAINDLREAGMYPNDHPAGAIWDAMVRRLADVVRADQHSLPIPLLLVTTTADRVQRIDPDSTEHGDGMVLSALLDRLGIAGFDDFCARYGERRRAWHPFGSPSDVHTILEGLSDELNAEIQQEHGAHVRRFHWQYVDEEFWSSREGAVQVARRLGRGPAVVVVDPLSFYDLRVFRWYANYLDDVLANGDAYVLVLAPFAPLSASLALRDMMGVVAHRIFRAFYRPPAMSDAPYPRWGIPVGDEIELWGWVAAAVGPQLATGPGQNLFLRPAAP